MRTDGAMTTRQRAEALVADAAAQHLLSVAALRRPSNTTLEHVRARRAAERALREHLPRLSARQRARLLGVKVNTVHQWAHRAKGGAR